MFLDQLRQHTRPCHQALEQEGEVVTHIGSRDLYRELIEAYHGYFSPLESQLAEFRFSVDAANGGRQRAAFLLDDLCSLGHSATTIALLPVCADLPPLPNRAAAMGCAYVVEGSALGGRLIGRMVAESLSIRPEDGGRFFYGWGEATGQRWRDFCRELEAFAAAARPQECDEALAAARDTFETLRRWLGHCWEMHDGE